MVTEADRAVFGRQHGDIGDEPTCGGVPRLLRQPGACDTVEFSSSFDHAGITAPAGASLLMDLVCLMASKKPTNAGT